MNGVHTSPEPVYQIATGQPITVSFANAAINPIVVNAPAGNGQITLLVQPSPAGDNPEVRFQMF
ncbi:hypothetical protein [uncultured Dokdonia sp.]|uniref:hypothetical protein n=1 Tax=uncultured Dokdonia sp. TaxID=575653 RepID=UPI0026132DBF|nr:hypothetical protein [uncultured Dokdonia sp.]